MLGTHTWNIFAFSSSLHDIVQFPLGRAIHKGLVRLKENGAAVKTEGNGCSFSVKITPFRRLAGLGKEGEAVQTTCGKWCKQPTEDIHVDGNSTDAIQPAEAVKLVWS